MSYQPRWLPLLALLAGAAVGSCKNDTVTGLTDGVCPEGVAPAELSLDVGESRRLDGDEARCFLIQRDGSQYVLTIANFGVPPADDPFVADCIAFARLVSPNDADTTLSRPPCGVLPPGGISAASSDIRAQQARATPTGRSVSSSGAGSVAPTASRDDIQNRLSGAGVDDSVWIPSRLNLLDECNSVDPASIPVFEAVVVAVEGNSVVAADTRLPDIDALLAPDARAKLEGVAATLDSVYVPTMRVLFSRTFQPPGGAGGRIVTLFTDMVDRSTVLYPDASPRSSCPSSIEVSVALLRTNVETATEAQVAGVALHEHAHGSDYWMGPSLRPTDLGTFGWATEALATTAQEQAARIFANVRAGYTQFPDDSEGVAAGWQSTRWGQPRPEAAPLWGPHANEGAAYITGGLLLLFVREQLDETWPDGGSGPRLYERVTMARDWSFEGIAKVVDMKPADLFDRFVLAIAMDDRLPPGVEPTVPLPQFYTWDNSWRREDDPTGQWRGWESPLDPTPFEIPLAVGAGTYGIWRIDASPGDAEAFGLRVAPVEDRPPSIIRITRYR